MEKDEISKGHSDIRKEKKKLLVIFILVLFTLVIAINRTILEREKNNPFPRFWQESDLFHQEVKYSNVTKTILIYTSFFGGPWGDIPWQVPKNHLKSHNCKIYNCSVTYDKKAFDKSDAVLFHARNMPNAGFLRKLRKKVRSHRQFWGYFIQESPANTPDPSPLHGLFNLTASFRKDSDVWTPYSKYIPIPDGEKRPDARINYAKDKQVGASWIVSHCGLLREQYIFKLQEFYPVHVGGGCKGRYKNQLSCTKDCSQDIRKYKFYIAFENGFCREYITEKYWGNGIAYDSVPIVMGAGPYENGAYGAIPGSYINVKDFKTIKELANYLNYLDHNDTAYNEYFAWKQKYRTSQQTFSNTFLCPLCEIVQRVDNSARVVDLNSFWGAGPSCSGLDNTVKEIIARS